MRLKTTLNIISIAVAIFVGIGLSIPTAFAADPYEKGPTRRTWAI